MSRIHWQNQVVTIATQELALNTRGTIKRRHCGKKMEQDNETLTSVIPSDSTDNFGENKDDRNGGKFISTVDEACRALWIYDTDPGPLQAMLHEEVKYNLKVELFLRKALVKLEIIDKAISH